jgi:membrane fusion protein (multidrug efflux system)
MKNINKIEAYFIRILGFIQSISVKILPIFSYLIKLKLKYKIIVAILLIAIIVTYKFLFGQAYPEDIKIVEVYEAKKGDLLVTTRLLGTITAKKYYLVTAGDAGTLNFVAQPGTNLKQGEIIAHIDCPEIENAYHAALKVVKIAEDQHQRELHLAHTKASSQYAVEKKYMQLAEAQTNLANAKSNMDKILFTAAFDGIVGSALFYPGSKVHSGAEIVTFYDPKELVVKFDIPSNLLVDLDDKAKVTIKDHVYNTFFIQRALSTGSYTIPAYIDFKCDNCIIGEITDVDLHLANKHDIIIIDSSCVFIRDGQTMIYKVKDNKAHISPVKIGLREKDSVEIIEGVEAGDIVVSQGQSRLRPEISVKIYEEGNDGDK